MNKIFTKLHIPIFAGLAMGLVLAASTLTVNAGVDTAVGSDVTSRELRAITIEGAYSLGLEDEIGSIEVGKRGTATVSARELRQAVRQGGFA